MAAMGRKRKDNPIGVRPREDDPHLFQGRADIGVVDLPIPPPGLTFTGFFTDTLVVLVDSRHPLAPQDRVAIQAVLDEDFIGLADATALSHRMQASAAAAAKTLKVRMRMRGFDAVARMDAARARFASHCMRCAGLPAVGLCTIQRAGQRRPRVVRRPVTVNVDPAAGPPRPVRPPPRTPGRWGRAPRRPGR